MPSPTAERKKRKAKVGTDAKSLKARVKQLESLLARQQKRIEQSARAAFKLPRSPAKLTGKGDFYRIIIPDTHGSFVDQAALAAFLADLGSLAGGVREIVLLGDHIDCGGFLAQHHTMGYVAEADYTFEQDVSAANVLLDAIQTTCPRATIHMLEGNHERRIERWIMTQVLANKREASYLASLFSAEKVLHVQRRGIHYYKQGIFYDGVSLPATIRLGKCYFTHGSRTGRFPARAMLEDFGGNVVFGHTHRMDFAVKRTVDHGAIGAWCPGSLCRLQPLWNHTQITGWSHGYGLQLVRHDGTFFHVNVPIIDGHSYLTQLTEKRTR